MNHFASNFDKPSPKTVQLHAQKSSKNLAKNDKFPTAEYAFFCYDAPHHTFIIDSPCCVVIFKHQLKIWFKNQIVNTQALHTGNHVELMDCGATVRDRCSFKHRGWTSRRTRSAHPSQIPINDHRVQAFVPKACTSCRFFAQCFAREAVLFVPPFGKDKSFTIVTLGARTCLITPLSNHRFSATPLIHR